MSFPCNDFNNQEPGLIKDIYRVYKYKFGITFPIHAKINVNGEHEHPLYTLLKCKQPGLFGSQIKWNFTKFVVDQQGNIVKRFYLVIILTKWKINKTIIKINAYILLGLKNKIILFHL